MIPLQRLCLCVLVGWCCGADASAESALEEKFAELVSKGLMSKEKLAMLKQQLLEDDSSEETDSTSEPMATIQDVRSSRDSEKPASRDERTPPRPAEAKEAPRSSEIPAAEATEAPEKPTVPEDKPAKKPRRAQSMEESMRAFGIDPDAINKLGERREPTDVNAFVAAAMQASAAQETARHRDVEVLEDQEEAQKEKEIADDEVHVESDGESASDGESSSKSDPPPTTDLGKVLPDDLQNSLAGIFAKFGDKMDPEASSLLSALLPKAGLEGDTEESEEEEGDGSTEDLAGLLAAARSGRGELGSQQRSSVISKELEDLERQRKESDERMEKAAEERKAEMARRQVKRDEEHKKFEAEMAEREEQSKKDRAEFEEGRKRHNEYMQKMEERKKASEKRREDNEKRREEQQDRMAEALKMAGAEIASLKAQAKKQGKPVHDEM